MTMAIRQQVSLLAKKIKNEYDFYNLTRNEDFYKLVVKHEADELFLTEEHVEVNWVYFKNLHRMYETGFHPADIRNFNSDYDF